MHWNYRVLRKWVGRPGEEEEELSIHEVYYENDIPISCTESFVSPHGETLPGLTTDLLWMSRALNKPVLDYTSLGSSLVMSPAPGFESPKLPALFTLEDVLKVAATVQKLAASIAFPGDEFYHRARELNTEGSKRRLHIESLDLVSIVSSCFNQPQQQSESDTK